MRTEIQAREPDHYCGAAPQSIAEYIARQPEEVQPYLFQIDEAIRSALPDTMQRFPGVCRRTGKSGT